MSLWWWDGGGVNALVRVVSSNSVSVLADVMVVLFCVLR